MKTDKGHSSQNPLLYIVAGFIIVLLIGAIAAVLILGTDNGDETIPEQAPPVENSAMIESVHDLNDVLP
ncbi:MAG: hypothetical protein JJU13_09775 [Balneolaceae bacterium]|nr:hypothetical protein [Balneolaceae bacterium]